MRISDWSSDVCSSDLGSSKPARAPRDGGDPTRVPQPGCGREGLCRPDAIAGGRRPCGTGAGHHADAEGAGGGSPACPGAGDRTRRSEEHTSELQSLMRISYAGSFLKQKMNNIFLI